MDIRKVIHIDNLIKKGASGSPEELSRKIGITKRSVYNYIKFMKEELGAPIKYSTIQMSYVYEEKGEFNFQWKDGE
ncbi:MAG: HTH domain-containing protein [Crocinitomicaceae bacterium]